MIRVRLPFLGVAALLAAPPAFAQAPPLVVYPSGLHVIVVTPAVSPADTAEMDFPRDDMEEGQLTSFEPSVTDLPKTTDSSSRIKPTPQQTQEPPCTSCDTAQFEEFPSFCPLPFAAPPPPPPPSGHKCRFRHRNCNNNGYGGYGNGGYGYGGNGYGGYGYGGYAGNCPSAYGRGHSCRRCQKHHQAPYPAYPGYGAPCMGCQSPWGWSGYGGFNNDGCLPFGYVPPPYAQQQKCCGFLAKHRARKSPCPRCGYPSYAPPSPAWEYPVAGWSTPNDGFNGFMDPNCLPGKKHCGLFRRCHKQPPPPPPPCFNPYWQAQWQPCMNDMAWEGVVE